MSSVGVYGVESNPDIEETEESKLFTSNVNERAAAAHSGDSGMVESVLHSGATRR